MKTLGIDLATDPRKTAAAMIAWPASGPGELEVLAPPLEDGRLIELIAEADVAGIDAPLGWPEPFVRAVAGWHAGRGWNGASPADLQQRTTDSFVVERMRIVARERGVRIPNRPMSVSADRIGATAMRAAKIVDRVARLGGVPAAALDSSGVPPSRIAEVYPAAALFSWGFPSTGYKGGGLGEDTRRALVRDLVKALSPIVKIEAGARGLMRRNDDVLDAVVAAVVTRAVAIGATYSPAGDEQVRLARAEGWIHIPRGPLSDIAPDGRPVSM
jgi:predicted nuclease with RNAse H fold